MKKIKKITSNYIKLFCGFLLIFMVLILSLILPSNKISYSDSPDSFYFVNDKNNNCLFFFINNIDVRVKSLSANISGNYTSRDNKVDYSGLLSTDKLISKQKKLFFQTSVTDQNKTRVDLTFSNITDYVYSIDYTPTLDNKKQTLPSNFYFHLMYDKQKKTFFIFLANTRIYNVRNDSVNKMRDLNDFIFNHCIYLSYQDSDSDQSYIFSPTFIKYNSFI